MNLKLFNNFKKYFLNEKGQVAVIVGLLLVGLVGLLAYVIDEGSVYESRRSFQTVADSAALAGAQELPEHPSEAVQIAIDYAMAHEVSEEALTIEIKTTFVANDTISVIAANMHKELFFGGIFGMDTTPVGADATAMIGSPGEFLGVVPWAVPETIWVPGAEYTLKANRPGSPGNFQAISIGGTGASIYQENITNGSNMTLNVGDIFPSEPGNMDEPTSEGSDARVYGHEDYNLNSFDSLVESTIDGYELNRTDSQFVICPVIEELPPGRDDVQIISFAPFLITGLNGPEIIGTFLHEALIIYEGSISGVNDTGIRVIRLIE
jgi:Flp pilus assembly protein TadG